MLIDTGRKLERKVDFGNDFACDCGKGVIDHNIRYSTLCIGYCFSCLSCGGNYFVAMASMKLYRRDDNSNRSRVSAR